MQTHTMEHLTSPAMYYYSNVSFEALFAFDPGVSSVEAVSGMPLKNYY